MRLVSPPTREHVVETAARMREADSAEAALLGSPGALETVEAALDASAKTWACLSDGGEVLFVAGVVAAREGVAYGWMLTTVAADRHPVGCCRGVVQCVREARKDWPVLVLAASPEHQGAVELVLRLGATPTGKILAGGRWFTASIIGEA